MIASSFGKLGFTQYWLPALDCKFSIVAKKVLLVLRTLLSLYSLEVMAEHNNRTVLIICEFLNSAASNYFCSKRSTASEYGHDVIFNTMLF